MSALRMPEPQPRGVVVAPDLPRLLADLGRRLTCDRALYCRVEAAGRSPEVVCSWTRAAAGPNLGRALLDLGRVRIGGVVGRALLSAVPAAGCEPLDPSLDGALAGQIEGAPQTHVVHVPARLAAHATGVLIATFSSPPPTDALTISARSCAEMLEVSANQL